MKNKEKMLGQIIKKKESKKQNTKGITLVALVITIIVLIILAGISINLILGQNGILNKAKNGTKQYEEEQAREKLELVLADLQADKYIDSNYTEDTYIDDRLAENGIEVEGNIAIVDGWQFEIDRGIPKITEALGKLTQEELLKPGIINLETIAKETEIEVTVTLRNTEGATLVYIIKDVETNQEKERKNITELHCTFSNLEKGKTYEITVEATNEYGTSIKTMQTTTTILMTQLTFTENKISIKAGETKQLEYTIVPENTTNKNLKWTSDEPNIIKVENGKITALKTGNAKIVATSTDGSNISAECVIEVTRENYGQGQKVNYTANGISDWKIFYKDEERKETFIITSDYLPIEKIPTETEMTTYGKYQAYWDQHPIAYPNASLISSDEINRFKLSWVSDYSSSTNFNIKCVAALMDTNIWKDFAVKPNSYAIGSPTLEMWVQSWNDYYSSNRLDCNTKNDNGYNIGFEGENATDAISLASKDGYDNPLFFPYKEVVSDCQGYWLASPSGFNKSAVVNIKYDGYIWNNDMAYSNRYYNGLRPVVCLPSDSLIYNEATGSWDVK